MDTDAVLWLLLALLWFGSARYESRGRNGMLFCVLVGLFFVLGAIYDYYDYPLSWRLLVLLLVLLAAFYFGYRDYREHGPSKQLVTWWRWWRGRESE